MGYAMSRLEIESNLCEDGDAMDEDSSSQKTKRPLKHVDNEIVQITKLKSTPHQQLGQVGPGRPEFPVFPVKMLGGRESNYSGREGFLRQIAVISGTDICLHIRIYDVDNGWKIQKNILAKSLRWTITDTSLSRDQHHLVYASMSPIVHIVNIGSSEMESLANVTEIHDGLDFSSDDDGGYSFGIFCVKFSTDGRELVAGSSGDSIYVYDLEANKLSLRVLAHMSDVNTGCFADETSHLIYSGSDDSFCKAWGRRCLIDKGKPAGVLMGHLEGITFIDTRGDGHYFISNGKDQTIKLWDIRKINPGYRSYEWDYRWMDYPPQAKYLNHPLDQSVSTYRGHSVLRTLIRCYFSPAFSTGQKYIYTGSHNACVYVYDLVSGDQVATLKHHKSPVRDCSWHPSQIILVSSSWDEDIVKWGFTGSDAPTS
ncbi:hypothetical protein TanjilG_24631 [Lupinus angustifolius]|uniref:Uncharacterized protein n=1 Tax=Lupinus angustifolius TaxID=3871 RepID=A0A4P1RKV1_LUPAN|nr:hypothetical protein TanjilG_24631 [Lupinus angustifolius]